MKHLMVLDMSCNKSQAESVSQRNINITTKVSARIMDSNKGDTAGTASMAKDSSLTGVTVVMLVRSLAITHTVC